MLDDLIDLPHLGALADHRAERAVLAQLAPQHADLAQRRVALDDLAQEDLQPLEIDRLGEVVVGAVLDRFDRRLDRSLRGQDDGRDRVAGVLDLPEQVESAHPGHHQIGQDDGRVEGLDLGQRLLAVCGRFDVESPAADQLLEADASRAVVFDNQNAFAGRHAFQSSRFYGRRAKNQSPSRSASNTAAWLSWPDVLESLSRCSACSSSRKTASECPWIEHEDGFDIVVRLEGAIVNKLRAAM